MVEERTVKNTRSMPHMATLRKASELTPFSYYMLRKMCLTGQVACVRNSGKFYINLDSLIDLMNGGDKDGE